MPTQPPFPRFHEKLRLNNLYPALPQKRIAGYPLYEQFKREQQPMIEEIGQQVMAPQPVTKPMDVVFNDNNISEVSRAMGAAKTIHNIDLQKNALSPYQQGQLMNKDRDLDIREQNLRANQEFADRRVAQTEEMNDFNQANPTGSRIVEMRDGNTVMLDRSGKIIQNLGPSGRLGDANRLAATSQNRIAEIGATGANAQTLEGLRQTGRMQSGDQRGTQQLANIAATAANKPIQTNTDMDYRKDAEGNIIGITSRKREITAPKGPVVTGESEQLLGPDGRLYTVPIDRVEDAITNGGMKRQDLKFGEIKGVKR